MLPMVAGMMTATTVSGQITAKTGKYKPFMIIGTGLLMLGYVYMFTYQYDTPIWQVSIGMVLIGLGLGQLMQTLTLAAQNAVPAQDIGVATSSTMFFRQIGGTLGVAIFISILFNNVGDKIKDAFKDKNISADFAAKVQEIGMKAYQGKLPANDPNVQFLSSMKNGATSGLGDKLNTDSSFLKNLDPALAKPFLVGFSEAAVIVFECAAPVVAVAFLMSWFIKAAPLRTKSAAEEKAAAAAAAAH